MQSKNPLTDKKYKNDSTKVLKKILREQHFQCFHGDISLLATIHTTSLVIVSHCLSKIKNIMFTAFKSATSLR